MSKKTNEDHEFEREELANFLRTDPKGLELQAAVARNIKHTRDLKKMPKINSSLKNRSPEGRAEIKAMQDATQKFLEQVEIARKKKAKEIDKDVSKIFTEHTQYSKTQAVNKIYRLLRDLLDYKLNFVNYPRTSEEMVKLLNFLVEIIDRFDSSEMIIPTEESPFSYQECINLLMAVAAKLPQEYALQVKVVWMKPKQNSLPQKQLFTPKQNPLPQEQPSAPEIAKKSSKFASVKAKKKSKKKAKKAQELNKMPPSHEERNNLDSPDKAALQTTESDTQAQPSIPKPTPIKKSNRHQNKIKLVKIKHVNQKDEKKEEQKVIPKQLYWDWEDDDESEKQQVSQKQLPLKNNKKDQRVSSNSKEEKQKVSPKQSHLDSEKKAEHVSSSDQEEEKKVVQKQAERVSSNNQKKEQKVVQKRFFWSDNKQNSSLPNSAATTQTVDMHQTIHRTYWPNGEIKEEFVDNKLSVSQRREVEYKPLPRIVLEPAIQVTKFALTSSLKIACLESMQLASMKLYGLIQTAQSLNDRTLEEYYNHVISFHNHIQSLSEQESVSPEIDYQCPVNPETVLKILEVNWAMHENFTKLFEGSGIMASCIAWRYQTLGYFNEYCRLTTGQKNSQVL